MNLKSKRALYIFLAAVLLLIGCDVSTLVAPPQISTPVPGAINLMVAQTAAAAATQTAALRPPTLTPTLTPFPTQTPADTSTITPTFIFILPSPTPTEPKGINGTLKCYLISQVPQDGANFGPNKTFTLNWELSNSGSSSWPQNSVSLNYVSGDQFTTTTVVNLPNSIAPGTSVTLTIDMMTPSHSGKYTTYWSLVAGSQPFCNLSLRITVR